MHVERYPDDGVRVDDLSDPGNDLAIRVGLVRCDGSAVEGEQDHVPGAVLDESARHPPDEELERFLRDRAHRVEIGVNERDAFDVIDRHQLEEAGERRL